MRAVLLAAALATVTAGPALAQKAPEMGYVYPPGGRAGTTVDVRICGYDWTPDMQFFTLAPGAKLEVMGPPGPILVPPPPYWFGAKAYLTALPLPREVPARLTLPAGLPPGPIRWQAANANGGTATGVFIVSAPAEGAEVAEAYPHRTPQPVGTLPAVVNGRLEKIEEVDRYRFTAARSGPVSVELIARGLGANFNGVLEVFDSSGKLVTDRADTSGNDAALTFAATAGTEYTLALHDVDFRGDRSFVYRLRVWSGPRVVAAFPAAGRRGETQRVELALDTGDKAPERLARELRCPAEGARLSAALETPHGPVPLSLPLSDLPESVIPRGMTPPALAAPAAVTGELDAAHPEVRFPWTAKAGEAWRIAAEARAIGSPLDLAVRVLGPDGKELARGDDLPETTDAAIEYRVPADGAYTLAVSDLSGARGAFRLSVEKARPDFRLQAAVQQVSVPLGGAADLVVRVARSAGFNEPVSLAFTGLPEGVTAPAAAQIPAGAAEVKVPLRCAADAPATAALIRVAGTAMLDGQPVTRSVLAAAGGNLVPQDPDETRVPEILVAVTMKPVCKVEPVNKDGGRRIPRGATYPAPVIVTRMEGFQGDVALWMSAHQSYTCMGITGPDIVVPADVTHTDYPCFMPEWLETARTSRMIVVAVAKVADPRGNVRHLVSLMDGRITMSIEGAMLKVSHPHEERTVRAGASFRVPVKVVRSPELSLPVRITLVLPPELEGLVKAEPLTLEPGRSEAEVVLTTTAGPLLLGEQSLTLRATAMQPGNLAVVSETEVPVLFVDK